ncbi:zinc-dependent alcohol dehydrogenase family protein [Nissabacter sp. SGAir0207]|uniref:zinc-dependent alcohol dehydrogenase family protein n=1 Tax=Nissabacter sp. SGAir0207 TaxID=2126321 RepID=UPI0010CCF6CC|nr:zinc-dependent alcohol dehydrogenase family protein [Nissabacter sp. SGAir0207]QCR38225.1 alcohol dehydrogenase [Nissabacter sp. SGAir0207]
MNNTALWYREFGAPEQVLVAERAPKPPLAAEQVRVKMLYAPVNASDLIPITGAYRHRITLPQVAGYEGVGVVIAASTPDSPLLGRRVLPLRGEGTWQEFVDCPAALAIPVPEEIESTLAARAYINPLAAQLMLAHFPPAGKEVLLTAAGSECALLLGQWARRAGARSVAGVTRSAVHARRLEECGIIAIPQEDDALLRHHAARAGVVYDAVGGPLAERILAAMPTSGEFVSYGLLSGRAFPMRAPVPRVHWFHVRHHLGDMTPEAWQHAFHTLWPALKNSLLGEVAPYPAQAWQEAIGFYRAAGRGCKPLLSWQG